MASQDDHFEAMRVVEMHVHRRDDHLRAAVLDFGQLVEQPRAVMIVNQSERGDGVSRVFRPGVFGQGAADEQADRFAAGRRSVLLRVALELFEQVGFERHAESDKIGHGKTFPNSEAQHTQNAIVANPGGPVTRFLEKTGSTVCAIYDSVKRKTPSRARNSLRFRHEPSKEGPA